MFIYSKQSHRACECGAEEQTADHVISSCTTYRAPMGYVVWRF